MSHLLEFSIPLRLQCYRVPADWRWEQADGAILYRCTVPQELLSRVYEDRQPLRLGQFDPWEMRLKFLDVDLENPPSVVAFLNRVGLLTPSEASPKDDDNVLVIGGEDGRHVIRYEPARAWSVENDFHDAQDFCREWPCHLTDPSEATFESRIAPVKGAPTHFITVTNFYDAFQIAFAIDQTMRSRRAKCKRPNCGKTYTFTGNRKRKYCSEACGHYMAVKMFRKKTKAARRRKKGRKAGNGREKESPH